MRIISGKFRGRKLAKSDHLKDLRPTSDRNREALFNILTFNKFGYEIVDSKIADLCCGTGAVGFEALSRGAQFVKFVDVNREHLALVKKNAEILDVVESIDLTCCDIKNLDECDQSYDLVFLDPPYERNYESIVNYLLDKNWIKPETLLVVETSKPPMKSTRRIKVLDVRTYGSTNFIFLKK